MSTLPSPVLEKLLALSRRLTSRRDLDGVLQELLDGSLQLIVGSDFACVFLYDSEENELVPVGGVGFDMQYMQHVRLKPGESLSGMAFVQKRPLLLPQPQDVKRAQLSLRSEHDRMLRLAVGRPTNPVRSSIAVPLIVEQRTVGVLVIDNYDTDRDFTPVDLRIACVLADHAAIAVANAQDYQLAQVLSRDLQKAMAIQRKLLHSILPPDAGFQGILRTLSSIIGRTTVVESEQGDILAHHGRQPVTKRFAIRAGSTVFGQLGISGGPLSRTEANAIEQSLPLVALEFVKRRTVREEQQRLRTDLVIRLMDKDPDAMRDVEHLYPWLEEPWVVILVGLADRQLTDDYVDPSSLANSALVASIGHAELIVTALSTMERTVDWARSLGAVVLTGDSCQGFTSLPDQLRGVHALWQGLNRHAPFLLLPSSQLFLHDFPAYVILPWISALERRRYVEHLLGPILGDSVSLNTLRTWLLLSRSYSQTAAVLHTHPNTIRYRIHRIDELLHRDLSRDDVVSSLILAVLWVDTERL